MLAIVAVFIALSLGYSFATRLKYGPDEPAHFIYIRSLATQHVPPEIAHQITPSDASTSSHEGHQPPLYYAIMAVPFAVLSALGASSEVIWRVLRLLNILMGVAWILSVYALSLEFFNKEKHALAAAAFVALVPTSAYISGVINNEVLISFLFTWAMLPILAYFKSGRISNRSAVFLGLLAGLAMLTKAQGMVLVPVFLLASLAVCRRENYANGRQVLISTLLVLGIAGLVSGWWFARCWTQYGTIMPQSLHNPVLAGGLRDIAVAPVWLLLKVCSVSSKLFYGYFFVPFWLVQPFVNTWNTYFYPLLALSVFVFIGVLLRFRRDCPTDWRSVAFLALIPVSIYLAWLRYILVVDSLANLQGRLLCCGAGVIGILAVLGMEGWLRSARTRRYGLIISLALMLFANIGVIGCAVALYR